MPDVKITDVAITVEFEFPALRGRVDVENYSVRDIQEALLDAVARDCTVSKRVRRSYPGLMKEVKVAAMLVRSLQREIKRTLTPVFRKLDKACDEVEAQLDAEEANDV